MRYDLAFGDAIYVVYSSWDERSPSTSVFMCPGTYIED
jgi:hypothetical protein